VKLLTTTSRRVARKARDGGESLLRVLQRLDAVLVSVSILFEIVGSTLLAWIAFGETPPAGAYPAAVLIAAGIVLVVLSGRPPRPVPAVD